MCTITYIPDENNDFYLTHNRDEDVKRSIATPPVRRIIDGQAHIFPVDPQGRGTWIGMSEQGRVASLMNGGSKNHQRKPTYRHSRGLIIPAYFSHSGVDAFLRNFDFSDLEPFTLLIFEFGRIVEIIKDDDQLIHHELDPNKPFIRSSRPLYTDKSMEEKKITFLEWLFRPDEMTNKRILDFHKTQTFERTPDKSKVPHEHLLRTVSITSVHYCGGRMQMHYLDTVNDISFKSHLEIPSGVCPGIV